jgi:hypothetical protein
VITAFLFFSCVTTEANVGETIQGGSETVAEEKVVQTEKKGIIFSSRQMTDGPLLLGSKEHMSGPVVEFSILYSLCFPLSGIVTYEDTYKESEGTRWQILSVEFDESVYFERALLSEDDDGNRWWYLLVEGDGYRREFEFLLDPLWTLVEMRYFDQGAVKVYYPSVDENKDLSNGSILYNEFKTGKESIRTASGVFLSDRIVMGSHEYWLNNGVTGSFVQSMLKEDNEIIVTASLLEEKKKYKTRMDSY